MVQLLVIDKSVKRGENMLKNVMKFLKKIFNYNATKCLPEARLQLEGNNSLILNNNFQNFYNEGKNINMASNTNLSDGDINYLESYAENNINENGLKNIDLVDEIFCETTEKSKNEIIDNSSEENKFIYDINKLKEMDKKIDYYKKNTEELYKLSLDEISEMNFYYEKRVEKLEKKVNKN